MKEADYCTGLSLNCDLFWNPDKDVSFLTVKGNQALLKTLEQATIIGKMKVVDKRLTTYGADPMFGFSYLIVLGQSHMMVHTWPEKHFMNLDVFTCGNEGDPHLILTTLQNTLKPDHVQMNQTERGIRKDIKNATEKVDKPTDIVPAKVQ